MYVYKAWSKTLHCVFCEIVWQDCEILLAVIAWDLAAASEVIAVLLQTSAASCLCKFTDTASTGQDAKKLLISVQEVSAGSM